MVFAVLGSACLKGHATCHCGSEEGDESQDEDSEEGDLGAFAAQVVFEFRR